MDFDSPQCKFGKYLVHRAEACELEEAVLFVMRICSLVAVIKMQLTCSVGPAIINGNRIGNQKKMESENSLQF